MSETTKDIAATHTRCSVDNPHCFGQVRYELEAEGQQYCILHFPTDEKDTDAFNTALMERRKAQSFTFPGVWFPKSVDFAVDFAPLGDTMSEILDADFTHARFCHNVTGAQVNFGGTTSFIGATFDGAVNFQEASFAEGANSFIGATFGGAANFQEASFAEGANFSYTNFEQEAIFQKASFSGDANFVDARFKQGATFQEASFAEGANFTCARFRQSTSFDLATFGGETYFVMARFAGEASFANATYYAETYFFKAVFKGISYFNHADFRKDTRFIETRFSSNVHFDVAGFAEHTQFVNSEFNGSTFFRRAYFEQETSFLSPTFKNYVSFDEATFLGQVRFIGRGGNRVFQREAWVSFRDALLAEPDKVSFRSVMLRPAWFLGLYEANKVNLVNVDWPGLERGRGSFHPAAAHEELEAAVRAYSEELEAAVRAYRDDDWLASTLAQTYRDLAVNAEDNNRGSEASAFHYYSNDTLRQGRNAWALWRPQWWYWLLSGYGQRPGRALLALFTILVAFTILFSLMIDVGILRAFVYSFALIAKQVPRPEFKDPGVETLFLFLVGLETLFVLLQMGLLLQAVKNWVTRL